jgi:hypothetical protein
MTEVKMKYSALKLDMQIANNELHTTATQMKALQDYMGSKSRTSHPQ